jgi:hypothetical protein
MSTVTTNQLRAAMRAVAISLVRFLRTSIGPLAPFTPSSAAARKRGESPGIAVNPCISRPFRELVPETRGIGGDGSSSPLESEVARLQGVSVSGARRIRTADLLGAIRGGGEGDLRNKWLIYRDLQQDEGSSSSECACRICTDMRRCDSSRELLPRSSQDLGGRFNVTDLLGAIWA